MEYTVLGKTGLKISRIGFGGIPIQRVSKEQVKPLMAELAHRGVNYIDTARGYTVSEEYLGYALEGLRDQFVLATKSMARTKEAMEKDISVSLQNLRTDYIELYQIHNPSAKDLEQVIAPGGALEALQAAKAAGKIGHIGITLHSAELFEKALELSWVETIMFPYNIVETQAQALIERCAEKNIGFICMKPLAGGALEDARLAIRFVMQNPHVSVVIPGMAEEKEIAQNIDAAMDDRPLTGQELAQIEAIRNTLGTEFCRRCNYCAPCTVGINISGSILFEGYFNRYDLKDWAYTRYMAMPVRADSCVDCGVCESRCPYNLPIRKMLRKAEETFANFKK